VLPPQFESFASAIIIHADSTVWSGRGCIGDLLDGWDRLNYYSQIDW